MESEPLTTGEFIGISLVFLSLMILPGVIAYYTNHRRKFLIAILGVLLGWTVFGGIFLLTWVITQSNLKHSKVAKWAERQGNQKILVYLVVICGTLIGTVKLLEFLGYNF